MFAVHRRCAIIMTQTSRQGGLANVTHVLAVSSCKGGVGKSTVAVNLAFAMAGKGLRVGLFDADVYGPSLPTMVRPRDTELYKEGAFIVPLEAHGVKLMSFGWVPGAGGAAIMRGPRVSGVVSQLLLETGWGDLDVLLVDYPPGTGDIQLTLGQSLQMSAAVVVTTPQRLALVDVEKGIEMFAKLHVPTLAIVENMSYFACPDCGSKTRLFGEGASEALCRQFGIERRYELPIDPAFSAGGDNGRPPVLDRPEHPFFDIAAEIHEALETLATEVSPTLAYDVGGNMILTLPDGSEREIPPATLRRACTCAYCVDENTGAALLDPTTISEDIYPTAIEPMGNYAVAVEWSENVGKCPRSIFPMDHLVAQFGNGW